MLLYNSSDTISIGSFGLPSPVRGHFFTKYLSSFYSYSKLHFVSNRTLPLPYQDTYTIKKAEKLKQSLSVSTTLSLYR